MHGRGVPTTRTAKTQFCLKKKPPRRDGFSSRKSLMSITSDKNKYYPVISISLQNMIPESLHLDIRFENMNCIYKQMRTKLCHQNKVIHFRRKQ